MRKLEIDKKNWKHDLEQYINIHGKVMNLRTFFAKKMLNVNTRE
jgi:hypothetical protein